MPTRVVLILCPPHWNRRPPLGLGFLEATLLQTGIDVTVCDLNVEWYNQSPDDIKKAWLSVQPQATEAVSSYLAEAVDLDQLTGKVLAADAACYCLSLFNTNRYFTLKLAQKIKRCQPAATVVVGGPQVLYEYWQGPDSDFFNTPEIDHFVAGEGETALVDIINGQGKRVMTYRECGDLNRLPFPRYQGFNLAAYQQQNMLSVLFSRGCVQRCAFCAECGLSRAFRMRSAANMIDEVAYHHRENHILTFIFHDSLINGNTTNLWSFCELVLENGFKINWEAQLLIRPDIPEGLLPLMKESGCYNLFIGLESGSDRVLKMMGKGYTSRQAAQLLKKMGLLAF